MNLKDEGGNNEADDVRVAVRNDGTIFASDRKPSDILFQSPGKLVQLGDKYSKTTTFAKMLNRNEAVYQVCSDLEKYNLAQSIVQVFQEEFEARFLLQMDVNTWRVMPKAMAVIQTLSIMQEKLQRSPTTIPMYEEDDDEEEDRKESSGSELATEKSTTRIAGAKLAVPSITEAAKKLEVSPTTEAASKPSLALSKIEPVKAGEPQNSAEVDELIQRSIQAYHKKLKLSPFPISLHQLISEIEIAAKVTPDRELVAQFVSGGDAFTISNPQQFEKEYLKIIGIDSLTQFQEELERHNFRQIQEGADVGGYVHALFRQQFPALAEQIQPKTNAQIARRQLPIVEG
mmetsp:Transcript_14420/g.22230  ORF Transcript_14420/g.22230 Transcript_14420/m.22230 type:complete len:344 (-) Transcript_14420:65-1096(-)